MSLILDDLVIQNAGAYKFCWKVLKDVLNFSSLQKMFNSLRLRIMTTQIPKFK